MKPAWRGVVWNGEVWAWPTLLWDHNNAFSQFSPLMKYTCRWRQWEPGGKVDFDDDASEADIEMVLDWIRSVS